MKYEMTEGTKKSRGRITKRYLHQQVKKTDPKQVRAGKNIAVFAAVMIVLTIVARGSNAATLAVVNTCRYSQAEVTEAITGYATVSGNDTKEITAPEALGVKELIAEVGQTVDEGAALLSFDPDELAEAIATAKNEYKKLKLNHEELLSADDHDSSRKTQAEKALQWAREDLASVKSSCDKEVARAKEKLEQSKKYVESLENELEGYVPPESSENPEVSSVIPDRTEELKVLIEQAKENVETNRQALEAAEAQKAESVKAAERNVSNAETDLLSAQKSDSESIKTEQTQREKNLAEAESVKLQMDKQEKTISELEKILQDGCVLKSDRAGKITGLPNKGDKGAAVSILDMKGEYIAEMAVDKNKKVNVGDTVELIKKSGSYFGDEHIKGTVTSVSDPDENNQCSIKIRLPEKEWKEGENLEARIIITSDVYSMTVPISAVHSDNSGEFVYAVSKKNTILGKEDVLYRVQVTVKASDQSNAAVEGALGYDEEIVVSSTKPVSDGARVRVQNEN